MRRKPYLVALISCMLTLFAVFLTFSFMPSEKKIERQLQRQYATDAPQFRRSMGVLLGPPIVDGNQVEILLNGERIFAAMLGAIRAAERSITFETYIYWSESIGREFSAALIERARAGVKVHVMLDFIGSIKMEAAAGVGIADKWRGDAQDQDHWRDWENRPWTERLHSEAAALVGSQL